MRVIVDTASYNNNVYKDISPIGPLLFKKHMYIQQIAWSNEYHINFMSE